MGGPPLDRALECVVDGGNPVAHVFFRSGLINSFEMRCDYFEAESPVSITRCSDRGHAKIDGFHVQIKLLLPIAVL